MKKIVIVGGGFTGSQCAMKLEKDFDVVLIDNKSFFEFTPGILRTILEPEHKKKIQAMHKDYLKRALFIEGEVDEISKKDVKLKNGKKISYNYLIIASGSSYTPPIKKAGLILATRTRELVEYYDKLREAKDVLIIGGGLVGVELAAEIITHYKNKRVILLQAQDKLIPRNSERVRKHCENFLKKKGVEIILGERIKNVKGKKKVSDKRKEYDCDMAFICTGIKSNYEFMKKNMKRSLDEKNHIIVNENLQVKGFENIFSGGDVVNLQEEKIAQSAEKHAKLICKNIRRLEKNKTLKKYKSKRRTMVISLGKYHGVYEGKVIFTGIIPAFMKWFIEKKTMWKYR